MSWRNLLASIFGDFCGGSNCPGVTPTIPAKKADAREFQDCYCARIGLCWAPSSRMIDRISPTIRNEPVTRIQPRPRANADARITALRGCESSSAARSSSSAKRQSSPGAHDDLSRCAVRNYARNHRCSAFQNSDLLESDGSVSGAENGRVLKADIG